MPMEQKVLMDILIQFRRFGNLLDEILDFSGQLEDALRRGDEVVIKMVAAMRAEPVYQLKTVDRNLRNYRDSLSEADKVRLNGLLDGTISPQSLEEEQIVMQASRNRRIHQQVMEMDRILNKKITRDKSIY